MQTRDLYCLGYKEAQIWDGRLELCWSGYAFSLYLSLHSIAALSSHLFFLRGFEIKPLSREDLRSYKELCSNRTRERVRAGAIVSHPYSLKYQSESCCTRHWSISRAREDSLSQIGRLQPARGEPCRLHKPRAAGLGFRTTFPNCFLRVHVIGCGSWKRTYLYDGLQKCM